MGSVRPREIFASDTGTIVATNTYADVPHGLGFTPEVGRLNIEWISELGGKDYWISNKGALTFRVNISSIDFSNLQFEWSYRKGF